MERETGDPNFSIWLIGDSNPVQWEAALKTPFDPRHPIIHNIWTSVLDVLQDKVYREARLRVDTSGIYIRNAVDDSQKKPKSSDILWTGAVEEEIKNLENLVKNFHPILLVSFGAFAYEFTRRSIGAKEPINFGCWGAKKLGIEFSHQIADFKPNKTNVISLLHRSISGGKYIESHDYFTGTGGVNYFDFVGNMLAEKILQYKEQLPIWIR